MFSFTRKRNSVDSLTGKWNAIYRAARGLQSLVCVRWSGPVEHRSSGRGRVFSSGQIFLVDEVVGSSVILIIPSRDWTVRIAPAGNHFGTLSYKFAIEWGWGWNSNSKMPPLFVMMSHCASYGIIVLVARGPQQVRNIGIKRPYLTFVHRWRATTTHDMRIAYEKILFI